MFEHLNTLERAIAEAALAKRIITGNAIYDVKVGEGFVPSKFEFSPEEIAMAKNLTQKRIDAIDWIKGALTIFEFTPRLSARSIGQLISYSNMWQEQNPTKPKPELRLVVAEDDKDLRPTAEKLGIEVFVV